MARPKLFERCGHAEPNSLGRFTAAAVEAPLSAIMGQAYRTPSFVFHLNEMCGPDRGGVLRKTDERRTYQYYFADSVIQPYVVMKSLAEVRTHQTAAGWRWEIYEAGNLAPVHRATTDYPSQQKALEVADRLIISMYPAPEDGIPLRT